MKQMLTASLLVGLVAVLTGIGCCAGGQTRKATSRPSSAPSPVPAARQFSIREGKVYDPDGKLYVAAGLNLSNPSIAQQVMELFPGINYIRIPDDSMREPSHWKLFIETMTAHKVVCEIEYHPWPLVSEPTPSRYVAWITSIATAFKDNPYVWIGSMNEPQGGDITAEHVVVYDAVRKAGNENMVILVGGLGGGNPGSTGAAYLKTASYSAMHRVAWDLHYYGWMTKYSTDVAKIQGKLLGNSRDTGILSLHAIHSADGKVPVFNAEFGPSTSGSAMDANWNQDVDAMTVWAVTNGYTSGYAAWNWDADPFNAVQAGGKLTVWGTRLKSAIEATKVWLAAQQGIAR